MGLFCLSIGKFRVLGFRPVLGICRQLRELHDCGNMCLQGGRGENIMFKTKRLKIVDFSLEVNCITICEQIKTDSLITHCFEICSICVCVGVTN